MKNSPRKLSPPHIALKLRLISSNSGTATLSIKVDIDGHVDEFPDLLLYQYGECEFKWPIYMEHLLERLLKKRTQSKRKKVSKKT